MLIRKFFKFTQKISKNKGFTLIEVLISILILIIGVLAVITSQSRFATTTADRAIRNALVDAAASALQHCENTLSTPPSSYTYGGITVSISVNGSCSPSENRCNDVTATASVQGKSFSLTTKVCNFR